MIDENSILALVERLEVAEKEVRAQLAEKDRTIYELNCAVQEAKRERDGLRAALERARQACPQWCPHREHVDAALSAPAQTATAAKLADTGRHKDGSHCHDKGQCRRAHLYAHAAPPSPAARAATKHDHSRDGHYWDCGICNPVGAK